MFDEFPRKLSFMINYVFFYVGKTMSFAPSPSHHHLFIGAMEFHSHPQEEDAEAGDADGVPDSWLIHAYPIYKPCESKYLLTGSGTGV